MLSFRRAAFLALSFLPLFVYSATQSLEWNITYTTANPDGQFERRVIGVNGQWPPPAIELNLGDTLVLNVNNQLGDVVTGLHTHGLFQNGTNYYDGPVGVVQCGIAPGESLTYNFTVQQNGTYWIHSHVMGQYPDGLRSPFIIHNPNEPFEYDEEFTLTFSDWYHEEMKEETQDFLTYKNPTGGEPIPQAALINDSQNGTIKFEAGKTYRLRLINIGAFATFHIWIEDHDMRVIELDGVYTKEYTVPALDLAVAQRVSVLVTAKNTTDQNFPLVGAMDTGMFDKTPPGLNTNVTNWIVYNESNPNPAPQTVDSFYDWEDTEIVPLDAEPVIPADESHQIDFEFNVLGDGANYAMFNGVSYKPPIVPTLLTALSVPANYSTDPTVYGSSTNPFVLEHNNMVEIVLNNMDTGKHPFHLHGHVFQVVYRSDENAGVYNDSLQLTFPENPMRRDTIQVKPNGFVILRFRADNPGIWLFHCHIEWHVIAGLVATFVEAPLQIQERIQFPNEMTQQCQKQNVPVVGNAANHTASNGGWLDLTGEPSAPPPLPAGFTAKGYGAMAGCCIAAVMGMITIVWYGLTELPNDNSEPEDAPPPNLTLLGGQLAE